MKKTNDTGHQITARKLMEIMLYDNGCVNRHESDGNNRYPKNHFDRITKACEVYFEKHPDLLTEDNLGEIAAGEQGGTKQKFGVHPEYKELSDALNAYFAIM